MSMLPSRRVLLVVSPEAVSEVRETLVRTDFHVTDPFAQADELDDAYEACLVRTPFPDMVRHRQVVDWVNKLIAPRCRAGHPPLWL
jgi:hypothetical protein